MKEVAALLRPLRISMRKTGMDVLPDGTVRLGGRAGPSVSAENVLHEVCHWVEIDEARMFARSFGLKFGRWVDCPMGAGGGYFEQRTRQHIDREMRVWAFQFNLQKTLGFDTSMLDLVKPVTFMPDFFCWFSQNTEAEQVDAACQEVAALTERQEFATERFLSELAIRKNLMAQRIEQVSRGVLKQS